MKRVLGLDASSRVVGWGFLEFSDDWTLISHKIGFFKPQKEGHIAERLAQTRQQIYNLLDELKPDEVIIEDILLQHRFGPSPSTTIKTLTTLAVFNRTICLAVLDKLGKPPYLYAVIKIRHAIKFDKKPPKKEEVPGIMEKYIPNLVWPKQTKGKNKGLPLKEAADCADGLSCAIAYYKIQTKPIKVKKSRAKK